MPITNATIIDAVEAYKKWARIYHDGEEYKINNKGDFFRTLPGGIHQIIPRTNAAFLHNWTIEWPAPVFEHWDKYTDAEWVAMDKCGDWREYSYKPHKSTRERWVSFSYGKIIDYEHYPNWGGDWRDSKIRRPEDE